jgi:hypothetical protein
MTKFVSPLKIEMVPGSGLNNWDDKGWQAKIIPKSYKCTITLISQCMDSEIFL